MPVIKPITDYVIQMKYLNYVINSSSQFHYKKWLWRFGSYEYGNL